MNGGDRLPLVDAVFALRAPEWRSRVLLAWLLAAGLHASLWLWASARRPSLESWAAELAAQVHLELSKLEVVDVQKPPAPPPAPSVAPPKTLPPRAAPRTAPAAPPPPAQAGAILAQAQDPDAPVDLTGETFITGTAEAYVGGVTATSGASKVAVSSLAAQPAPGGSGGEPSRASAVGLDDANWSCPWPREAEAEDVSEQLVVLKVTVRPDGVAQDARLVADPGHGFGQAALACALATRFEAARDSEGRPIASESPPLRVRFTR